MKGSLTAKLLLPLATVTKMIAIQALYQTTVTLVLHFGGPKLLRPVTGGRTADDTAFG